MEEPSGGAARGILRREEECEQRPGNLLILKFADQVSGLLHAFLALDCNSLAILLGLHHVQNPLVHDAGRLSTRGHIDFTGGSTTCKLGNNSVRNALAPPALGEGDVDGEGNVDQLERRSDEVKVVRNLLDRIRGDVVSEKRPARQRTVDLTEPAHERHGLTPVGLARGDKLVKVVGVDLLLDREVCAEGLVGEEPRQPAAVLGMGLAGDEDPCAVADDVFGDGDDAGLSGVG